MGGCKSLDCNARAQDIWEWAITRNIWLSAAHIPGASNANADALSRDLNLDLEWMLFRSVFDKIVALFGQPDIDPFASRLTAQLENYVSWKPDPMAKYVDAFTVYSALNTARSAISNLDIQLLMEHQWDSIL